MPPDLWGKNVPSREHRCVFYSKGKGVHSDSCDANDIRYRCVTCECKKSLKSLYSSLFFFPTYHKHQNVRSNGGVSSKLVCIAVFVTIGQRKQKTTVKYCSNSYSSKICFCQL